MSTVEDICQALLEKGVEYSYIRHEFINYEALVEATLPWVKEARKIDKKYPRGLVLDEKKQMKRDDAEQTLVQEVISIWFPAVLACINDHGDSWEHYHALDSDVLDLFFPH